MRGDLEGDSFFVTTILFAGMVRLLAEVWGGKGDFISTFCMLCIAGCYKADTRHHLAIMVAGIRLNERINWIKSILVTIVPAIPMTALMVIFVR